MNYPAEELASLAGISKSYLYRIENDSKRPSFKVLRAIESEFVMPKGALCRMALHNSLIHNDLMMGLSAKEQDIIIEIVRHGDWLTEANKDFLAMSAREMTRHD